MTSTSREYVRDRLVTLLTTALVGARLPVKTVSGSKVDKIQGKSPLVVVTGHGTNRESLTRLGQRPAMRFYIDIFVLQKGTSWTYAQAEDALDSIEASIATVVEANECVPAYWDSLAYEDASEVLEVTAEGEAYYWERIAVVVERSRS
jgi:hypothetical protein